MASSCIRQLKKKAMALLGVILLCGTNPVSAQWNVGMKGGLGHTFVRDENTCSARGLVTGNGGVVLSYTLTDRFDIQSEALLAGKNVEMKYAGQEDGRYLKYKAVYLDFPLLAKFYLTEGLNVQAGPQMGILLHESEPADATDAATMKRRNVAWSVVAGAGYEFRCNVFVDIRYALGLTPGFKGRSGFRNGCLMAEAGYMLHF
jgi:opacity protein-like surface antigen